MRKDISTPSTMTQSLKIVFFGNEHLATGVESSPLLFKTLLESNHQVVALVVHSSEQSGRSQKKEPIIELAEAHSIPVYNPSKTIDCLNQLSHFNADCGVLAAYGKMVPEEVINMFPHGIINLHPSLLPKLRGSTPLEAAILSGETDTGVSIMKLVKQMDAGPVYKQEYVSISPTITKQELASTLHQKGAEMMLEVLDNLSAYESQITDQDESAATFCTLISKTDGIIDWNKPADMIEREIRAYAGWPKSSCQIAGKRAVVHSALISDGKRGDKVGSFVIDGDQLGVQTSSGVLWITSLQPEGKKEMPMKAFLAGYKNKIF
jgi:methionyl-tRNA formyltransferase